MKQSSLSDGALFFDALVRPFSYKFVRQAVRPVRLALRFCDKIRA